MSAPVSPRSAADGTAATDPDSRHAQQPTYRRDVTGVPGEIVLLTPRLPDEPPAASRHRVAPGERLDLVAARLLGDPHRYWRIADANPTADLADLEVSGRDLAVPGGA